MKAKTPDEHPLYPQTEDGLWQAFFDTDEMADYLDATNKINAARERGDAEVSLPVAFLSRAIANNINFDDRRIVDAWNRCCDIVNLPGQKKTFGAGPGVDEMRIRNEVTVGHALTLKTQPDETDEDHPF
jgi:hypothetical protein